MKYVHIVVFVGKIFYGEFIYIDRLELSEVLYAFW
jgi:hypothetical protein